MILRRFRLMTWAAVFLASSIGGLVLIGWAWDIAFLKSLRPEWNAMRAVTAVCLILSGAALAGVQGERLGRRRRGAVLALCTAIILVSLLTIAAYIFRHLLGREPALAEGPFFSAFLSPDRRMAVVTAIVFTLNGIALALLGTGRPRAAGFSHALALSSMSLCHLMLVGYFFDVRPLYNWPLNPIAMHTALALFLSSAGILCSRPDTWLLGVLTGREAGGVLARRLFPALVLIPLLVGWLWHSGERAGFYNLPVGTALMVTTNTLTLLLLTWWAARLVSRTDERRRRMEDDVRRLNADLERRVEERTAELTRLNVELEKARDEALESARAKSQFLANMSHEIRTPLNAVIGMSGLILRTPLNDEQKEYADVVQGSAESLLAVVNDILDLSKIESGKMTLDRRPFDLRSLARETIDLFTLEAGKKGLDIKLHYSPDVPSALTGDEGRLRQVLTNLIGNAVKFTSRGDVRVLVHKEDESERKVHIRIDVSDTGIGIAPQDKTRLFQPFSQVDASLTRRFGGTGLGLAIAKQFVNMMGGTMGVVSESGKGSTFWFSVPLVKQPVSAEGLHPSGKSAERSESPLLAGSEERKDLAILVVEDNPINQKVVVAQLKKLGCPSDAVPNGRDALEALQKKSYDLIFMDCQMPAMDGYKTTEEIRKKERDRQHTPVIAMTAHAMQGDKEKCFSSGMDDYIAKPVHLEDLAHAINTWARSIKKIPSPSKP
ncbi:MAG: response regulator [Elusimicrobia bacterium]|nr:response regulator [Elusimicrobiota bacterium]